MRKINWFSGVLICFLLSSLAFCQQETEPLFVIIKDGKKGYIDKTGKVVIEPQFGEAWGFSEGLANVGEGNGGKMGYIDMTGKFVVPIQYDGAGPFQNGLGQVKVGKKWGFIDKTGKFVLAPQYDEAFDFHEGLVLVKNGEKSFFIDKMGKTVTKEFDGAGYFSEGLCPVKVGETWGYIDTKGNFAIPAQYADAFNFDDGLATVIIMENDAWVTMYIDTTGKVVWKSN